MNLSVVESVERSEKMAVTLTATDIFTVEREKRLSMKMATVRGEKERASDETRN